MYADLALVNGLDQTLPLPMHLRAAAEGDRGAQAMAAEIGRRIAVVAGTVSLVLDPEAFVLSGYGTHPVLVDAVHRTAEQYAPRLPLRFELSEFGPEAPLLGAIGEASAALRATLFTRILSPVERTGH